ncbi:MAG: tyrosine-type recombinase/integrase [Pirellulales bacterium]
MTRERLNEAVRCTFFLWRLILRDGVWYGDGRSNSPSAGRHSLGTGDRAEAFRRLPELDRQRAEDLGLAPRSTARETEFRPLPLSEGRALYENHIARPRVAGGVRKSTAKRYRTVFDKFLKFATSRDITVWNGVNAEVLTAYADHLEKQGYAHKSLVHELVTLKQAVKWLVAEGHLQGVKPIGLRLRKAESERAYCYQAEEIRAMIDHCRKDDKLEWLADVIVVLACSGLRIAELVSLRWADIDLAAGRLSLSDETGRPQTAGRSRRELKSGRSRSFPLHPDLLAVLRRLERRDGFVFHGPRGGRLKPDTVRRILVREVIEPLAESFPALRGEKGFADGRLHSFRHFFCSTCANNGVPERMVMDWLGHADSEMLRHYYHMHDEEARRRMGELDFLGGASGRSASSPGKRDNLEQEVAEPDRGEMDPQ